MIANGQIHHEYKTSFESILKILSELSLAEAEGEELSDEIQEFVTFHSVGIPLAFLVDHELCTLNDNGAKYIVETWKALLELCEIEDTGFESLADIMNLS